MPLTIEWLIIVVSAVFTPEPQNKGLTLVGASPGAGAYRLPTNGTSATQSF